jgi:hypothetical protein
MHPDRGDATPEPEPAEGLPLTRVAPHTRWCDSVDAQMDVAPHTRWCDSIDAQMDDEADKWHRWRVESDCLPSSYPAASPAINAEGCIAQNKRAKASGPPAKFAVAMQAGSAVPQAGSHSWLSSPPLPPTTILWNSESMEEACARLAKASAPPSKTMPKPPELSPVRVFRFDAQIAM